jgi:uncharacterized membrane protein YbaN (DUF454 family)
MIALLFALFACAIGFAMMDRRALAGGVFAVAMAMSVFWFRHHATSPLAIQL